MRPDNTTTCHRWRTRRWRRWCRWRTRRKTIAWRYPGLCNSGAVLISVGQCSEQIAQGNFPKSENPVATNKVSQKDTKPKDRIHPNNSYYRMPLAVHGDSEAALVAQCVRSRSSDAWRHPAHCYTKRCAITAAVSGPCGETMMATIPS